MKTDQSGKADRKKSRNGNVRWIGIIACSTILISASFSLISNLIFERVNIACAALVLLVIVAVGILFDVIGVAVTAADVKPFHSMAARRVPGAKEALGMLQNAEKVSSFCNDVVGDVCGVISGSASAVIVIMACANGPQNLQDAMKIAVAALVSGLTVGGKAVGKSIAMSRSTRIVHGAARVICFFKRIPGLPGRVIKKIRGQKKNYSNGEKPNKK